MTVPAGQSGPARRITNEVVRLTSFLHRIQRHPDFDYCMTFDGNAAHHSLDDWEPNTDHGDVEPTNRHHPTQRYWKRRRA